MNALWPISLTAASVLALLQACVMVAYYARLGDLLFREQPRYKALVTNDGPEIGSLLPPLSGPDVRTNEPVAAAQFHGRRLVLLFVSPGCGPCEELLRAVRAQRHDRWAEIAFLVIVQASAADAAAWARELPGVPVIADPEAELFDTCGVERTPLGVLVDAFGHVRMKGVVNNGDQLAGLIAGQGRPMGDLSWVPAAAGETSTEEQAPLPAAAPDRPIDPAG